MFLKSASREHAAVGSCVIHSETQVFKVNERVRRPSTIQACRLLSKTLTMVQVQDSKPACSGFSGCLTGATWAKEAFHIPGV